MGVYKEHAKAFEAVEAKCVQIYNDAADSGFPFDEKSPPREVQLVYTMIHDLQDGDTRFPDERKSITQRVAHKNGVTITIDIPWELDGMMEHGSRYYIQFARDRQIKNLHPGCTAFIWIHSHPYQKAAQL